MKRRPGIAAVVIVVALIVVIAVAGVGVYVFVFAAPSTSGASTSTLTIGTALSTGELGTATSTFVIGTGPSTSPTSGTQGNQTYMGTFSYVIPLGPFGINDSSGKPVEWNSTQTASGSFTFSINPATYLGSGSGQGSITVATRGYCTGSSTVQYTFAIEAVSIPGTKNVTIAFNDPTPPNVMVQLTCQGSTAGFNQTNNPVTFLSVYPNGLDLNSFPAKVSQVLTGGISYTYDITQAS